LIHGDLWAANLLTGTRRSFAVIDPAVSYGWAEVDLANLYGSGLPDEAARFFDVYREQSPLVDGWEDRRAILFLPIVLGTIAQVSKSNDISQWAVGQLRATLRPHYRRDRPMRR
jgi:fructosamine-3-kinase